MGASKCHSFSEGRGRAFNRVQCAMAPSLVAVVFALAILVASIAACCSAGEIAMLPGKIKLQGPEARHRLIVAEEVEDGLFGEQISAVGFSSSDEKVVTVENGVAQARGNGKAVITAACEGGKTVTAQITVTNFDEPFSWSFSNHVLPILSKNDCNSGGCHGAIAGKGGFRLSLRGYDPPGDFYTMTRELQGRRVEPADPARSLILTKPTMAAPHKGGKQLDPRSYDYRVLAEWIAKGSDPPGENEAKLKRLEVLPEHSVLRPGQRQKLIVRAHYGDGRIEDVTQWTKFSSTDETVASVSEDREASVIGHGEGAVVAWFSSQVVLARMTVPFPSKADPKWYRGLTRNNFVDDLVLAQLEQLKLKPSPRCKDEIFVRRVYLDAISTLPTPQEAVAFVTDSDPDKRTKLIRSLLHEREEFADYWSYRYSDIFLVNGKLLRPDAVKSYYQWIRDNVEKNTPWDEFARQLIVARGDSFESGATNFYAVHQEPETMAENVSQAFLCLSINCARCHNHPLEKWSNDQYYAFANLFARVRSKGWGGDSRNGNGKRTLYVEPRGDLIQPRTGKPQPPAPLDGDPIDPEDESDRRAPLADWLTAPDNPYFARAICNRIWAAFFGRGLVDPVDDLRASNPATNEPLLAALADHLVKNDFDVKSVMQVILESETYQRSSEALPENQDDLKYFSRYYPRRLMAEVLHDAIAGITRSPAPFTNIILSDGSTAKVEDYGEGTRSIQLKDSAVESYFLKTFGRNNREITCECERSNQPSMVQVLHLSNGDTLNKNLAKNGGIVDSLVSLEIDTRDVIDAAYLMCLSRLPASPEKDQLVRLLDSLPEKEYRTGVEDLFWALMTSREFLFQH